MRRQSSVPVTSRDRTTFNLCRQQMSTTGTMAIRNLSNERPSCAVSNQADPVVKPQSSNVIDLKAALEAVSAVATATAVVTRIPLQNSLATNSANVAANSSKNENSSVTENQENEEILVRNEIDNEEYLRQLHRYGVLLRIMGDKLDAEYGGLCYEMEEADHKVITQKPIR